MKATEVAILCTSSLSLLQHLCAGAIVWRSVSLFLPPSGQLHIPKTASISTSFIVMFSPSDVPLVGTGHHTAPPIWR
jgi:hypothetical protein